jgi:hypothetical protein
MDDTALKRYFKLGDRKDFTEPSELSRRSETVARCSKLYLVSAGQRIRGTTVSDLV